MSDGDNLLHGILHMIRRRQTTHYIPCRSTRALNQIFQKSFEVNLITEDHVPRYSRQQSLKTLMKIYEKLRGLYIIII